MSNRCAFEQHNQKNKRKKRKRQSFNDNLHTYPYTNSTIWWYWIDIVNIHAVRIQNRSMLRFASVKFSTVVSCFFPRCRRCSDFYYCSVYTALFFVRFAVKDCVSVLNGILSQFVFCIHSASVYSLLFVIYSKNAWISLRIRSAEMKWKFIEIQVEIENFTEWQRSWMRQDFGNCRCFSFALNSICHVQQGAINNSMPR